MTPKDQPEAGSEEAFMPTNGGFVLYAPKNEAEPDPMVTGFPRVCLAQDLQTQHHCQDLQILQAPIQVPPSMYPMCPLQPSLRNGTQTAFSLVLACVLPCAGLLPQPVPSQAAEEAASLCHRHPHYPLSDPYIDQTP